MNAEIIERLDRSFSPGETFATKDQVERLFKVVTAQHDTVRLLGAALQSVSEAPVHGRTPFGEVVAQRFAAVGGLFADGKVGEAHKAFAELQRTVSEWSKTPEGEKAIDEDKKRFPKTGKPIMDGGSNVELAGPTDVNGESVDRQALTQQPLK